MSSRSLLCASEHSPGADIHHELAEAKTEMGKLQKALKIEELPVPVKHSAKK